MAGLLSMSSARLRCARTLRTIAERPPESEAGVEGEALEAGALRSGAAGMGCGAVNSRDATRLLGSTSLRGEAVGSRGASSHARLFWAGMRGESGCEGTRVGARRRRTGASN
jgi:hypothetical protein